MVGLRSITVSEPQERQFLWVGGGGGLLFLFSIFSTGI